MRGAATWCKEVNPGVMVWYLATAGWTMVTPGCFHSLWVKRAVGYEPMKPVATGTAAGAKRGAETMACADAPAMRAKRATIANFILLSFSWFCSSLEKMYEETDELSSKLLVNLYSM